MKKLVWPFSFYVLYFAAMASFMPFIVLFYRELGFSGTQIGLLTGVPPLVSLAAGPALTSLADATRRHTWVMGLGILASAVIVFFLPALESFTAVFVFIILFNILSAPVASLSDSATMSMLGAERAMYGRIRLGGTIGWGVFAQIAGVVFDVYGLQTLFYLYAGITLINLFVSRKLRFEHVEQGEARGSVLTFLTNRRWIFFLVSAFLGGLGAFTVAAYLSPYLQELGARGSQIGFAHTVATLTEVPVFFFGNRLIKRFSAYGLFLLALALIGVRSLLFAAADTIFLAILVQGLGGLIYPAFWAAGVAYADEHAPAGLKSTAQGIFGAVAFGIGSAVGGFVGGPLFESIGGRAMFLVFGIAILVGLALVEGIRRILPIDSNPQPVQVD